MTHLSDERILALAKRILRQEELSYQEVLEVQHIGKCDSCCELLQCMMAMVQVTDHIDLAAEGWETPDAVEDACSTIIQVTILNTYALLQQLQTQAMSWDFAEPLSMSRSGAGQSSNVSKLVDQEGSGSYIAYDPQKRTLVIRLTLEEGEPIPKVWLRLADGTKRSVEFQQLDDTLFARIEDLDEGEYQIILER